MEGHEPKSKSDTQWHQAEALSGLNQGFGSKWKRERLLHVVVCCYLKQQPLCPRNHLWASKITTLLGNHGWMWTYLGLGDAEWPAHWHTARGRRLTTKAGCSCGPRGSGNARGGTQLHCLLRNSVSGLGRRQTFLSETLPGVGRCGHHPQGRSTSLMAAH